MEAIILELAYFFGLITSIVFLPTVYTVIIGALLFIPFRKKHYWQIVISVWFVFLAWNVFKTTTGRVYLNTFLRPPAYFAGTLFSVLVVTTPVVIFGLLKKNLFRWIYAVIIFLLISLSFPFIDLVFPHSTSSSSLGAPARSQRSGTVRHKNDTLGFSIEVPGSWRTSKITTAQAFAPNYVIIQEVGQGITEGFAPRHDGKLQWLVVMLAGGQKWPIMEACQNCIQGAQLYDKTYRASEPKELTLPNVAETCVYFTEQVFVSGTLLHGTWQTKHGKWKTKLIRRSEIH